jgi:hypothetical protein
MVAIHFYLHNIPATEENPFKLLVNSDTVCEYTDSISQLQVVHDVGNPTTTPHQVYINVMINEKYIDELERYNLTKNGYHFSIGLDEEENLSIEQGESSFGVDIEEQQPQHYEPEPQPEPEPEPEPIVEEVPVEPEPTVEEVSQPALDVPPLNEEEQRAYDKLLNFKEKGYLTEEEFIERSTALFNDARQRAEYEANEQQQQQEQPQEHYDEHQQQEQFQEQIPQQQEIQLNENQIIRLERIRQFYEQGYITEEQFHQENEIIYQTPDEPVPADEYAQQVEEQPYHEEQQYQEEQPQEQPYQEESQPQGGVELSQEAQAQISRLDQFLAKGYISQQEYENKVASIISNAQSSAAPVATEAPKPTGQFTQEQQTQLDKLSTFLAKGYITQVEYNNKRREIHESAGVPLPVEESTPEPAQAATPTLVQPIKTPTRTNLTQEQQNQIAKLQQFLQKGIITQQEFENKKAQIEGTGSGRVSPVVTPKVVQPVVTPKQVQSTQPVQPVVTPKQVVQPVTTPSRVTLTQEQQNQIAKLQQFLQKGIITQQEFETKKAQIESKAGSNISPSNTPKQVIQPVQPVTAPKQVQPVTAPKQVTTSSTPQSRVVLTQEQRAQIAKLQQFLQKGIITQQEFETKKAQIEAKATTSSPSSPVKVTPTPQQTSPKPVNTPPQQPVVVSQPLPSHVKLTSEQQTQIERLASLRNRNLITEHEFQTKKAEIERKAIEAQTPQSTSLSSVPLSQEQQQQITRLQQFLRKGIINQQEYDTKKAMIEKEALQKQQNRPVQQSATSTLLTVFLNNIPASSDQPLTLLLNRTNVMYSRTEDIPASKSVVVKGNIPNQGGDLIVTLTIKIPALGIDSDQEFNLTQHGAFVLLGLDPHDNKSLVIKQQLTDDFPEPEPIMRAVPQTSNKPQGTSDIFIIFAGIPASEEQPFEIYINDTVAHKATQDMGQYQKGMIKGQVPKSKRSNDMSSPDHEILFIVKVPKSNIPDVSLNLNLTQDGPYVMITIDNGQIDVTQSHTDESDNLGKPKSHISLPSTTKKEPKKLSDDDLIYLKKLAELKQAGILTEEEFNKKKNDILG